MKGANHQLGRVRQVVIYVVDLTRPETRGPMRFFQLASLFCDAHNGPRGLCTLSALAGGDRGRGEKAILEIVGENMPVLQVLDRLSLGVQNGLYALDDIFAMA
jgi:hypothetical protein